ncbi:transglutaminase-like cysteine peptidase [Phyllobacterium sp. 628]|uniref:transglutaminase-like cysteine peptidase n=1 Tax=Phyllobacterium sp. 628 TaxID=2718938 RepID=UPI0016622373|nr:transglutaminase-like cysteine peptidase [Phyllobacterium sp. 628]QND53089.1 transglutaminase-like cysteine peptidase [Phyllobacterium sp. 628]
MIKSIILAGTTLLLMAMAAQAGPALSTTVMKTDGRTSQPIGHYDFCQTYQDECRIRSISDTPVTLTSKVWAQMVEVNTKVNTDIKPETDMEIWGKAEVWSYPTTVGDCEDYVLLKRKILMERGIPVNSLLITVVRQMNGEGHAVLTVRTDRGDYILDNLEARIKPWNDTRYDYLKRQSTHNTGAWVSITDDRQVLVGSIETQ